MGGVLVVQYIERIVLECFSASVFCLKSVATRVNMLEKSDLGQ